ncbi:hypothetical protein [Sphingomonas glacialis]|nr:hypothetical protein [Sphingomonas glacialis]
MSVPAFTFLHVVISLVGIAAGVIWLGGLVAGRWFSTWNAIFLITTIATSATGFLFHSAAFGPPHVVGVISLIVLAVSLVAMFVFRQAGLWRLAYVATAVLALYLNAFVGVVQSFQKISPLHALAPTGAEPAFFVAQGAVFVLFLGLGYLAVRQSNRLASMAGRRGGQAQPAY